MKITFVTNSMNFGGAERVMSLLANNWYDKGLQVDFIVMNDSHSLSYQLNEKIGVYYMQSPRFNKPGNLYRLIKSLRLLLKKSNPDVVISFFAATLTFAKWALWGMNVPLIYSERNDPYSHIKGFKAKFFQNIALHSSKQIIFQTTGARNYYGKTIRNKSSIILNPFEPSNLPVITEKKDKTLVSVGRLCKQKNQAMQICAFKSVSEKYPDYKLEIYGDGPLREDLEIQVRNMGLQGKVEFKGNRKDVLQQIGGAEIFLFSSWYEGLPNAVIEAMALGLPCVCTKCSPGGAEALIETNINGVLVDLNDAKKMAEEVIGLIENPDRRMHIGDKAKMIVDRLDINLISQQWLEVIEKVII